MSPDFASDNCFTCCKKPENFHKISDSDGDSNPNIRYIICQHFWFKEDDLRSAIVCETCWEKMDQFHQFYLDVKKLHEYDEVALLSMFIKQEEITIEETQLLENCQDLSAEDQKLLNIVDCKDEIAEELDELSKKEEAANVFPQSNKKINFPKRKPYQKTLKRKNPLYRKHPTQEERQVEDDFIKQHTRYNCDECNIEFENFIAVKKHRMKTHKKDNVMCCGSHYRFRSTLYEHVQSLLNPEAFKCEVCGNTFKSKGNYVRHKEKNHAAEEDLVFKCNRCPKSFIKEWFLKSHLAEHETFENETAKCELCGKCFHSKNRLNMHVKFTHKKPMDFMCEICSKGFYLRAKFDEHLKTHELTAEQLKEQCPVCNKWLKNHANWLQHVRRHKEKECKCDVCDHVSLNMKSLKMHMKYRHAPDIMSHVCELCGKHYSRAIYLKEHVANVHTKEHLYQCQYCEKKFFAMSSMRSHRKKDHHQQRLEDRAIKFATREAVSDGDEMVS